MHRVFESRWFFLSLIFSVGGITIPLSVSAAEIKLNGHTFTLPDGFEIELVAKSPLVDRPITASFDEQGRLYVSDSSGTNDKVAQQFEDKPHRIKRLEDTNGDGIFDKSSVFADKLMFPEGTLFYDGSLYVSAVPSIWKLTDTDGDGVADEREEWFQGKTMTGCANDLHGPYLGPDGFIYWCKGAFAEQNHIVHGKPWKTKAAHIYRCRPDGSEFDVVMNGGMDNPVDVVTLPDGERVFTTTFLVFPGNGQRDGLLHAVYGGVYGKDWGTLEGHPRTGEVMPILTHMGAAAPCGLTMYESTVFGDEFYGNLFACQFNMHKVSRHILAPRGASYVTTDSDLVISDNSDFHPTDVLEDADGSLIVVDTGGWYKLCCPTSQLHKPDILGAIYRIKKTGMKKVDDPRGLEIDWEKLSFSDLWKYIGDARPAVRQRSLNFLIHRRDIANQEIQRSVDAMSDAFDQALAPGKSVAVPETVDYLIQSIAQLWAIDRLDAHRSRKMIRQSLQFDHPKIRQTALHSISLHRDKEALPDLREVLENGNPAERRIAAEALGRIGDDSVIPDLLKAAGEAEDRFLEHSITYALIELDDAAEIEKGIRSENARVRRTALIALDQMPGAGLTSNQVIPLLASSNEVDLDTANWLLKHHPEWGNDLAGWFTEQFALLPQDPAKVTEDQTSRLESLIQTFTGSGVIQQLLADTAGDARKSPAARQLALRVMAKTRLSELPNIWADTLTKLLDPKSPLIPAAVLTARSLPGTKEPHEAMTRALAAVGESPVEAVQTKLDALAAIPAGLNNIPPAQFAMIVAGLENDNPINQRGASADILAKSQLSKDQLLELCDAMQTVGPLELDRVLAPYEKSTNEAVGLKLLASLEKSPSLTSIRMDSVRTKLAKYSPGVLSGVDKLEALVNVDAATQRARIEELLKHVSTGDVRRGQLVFNSAKAACLACHKFGYGGGLTGPDLTKIGSIRQERDLLESILYPSLSFVRSYEPIIISTVQGKVVNGLIRNETTEEIVLATGPNKEERVKKADIEETKPSTVSIMPAGLDKQLSEQDLLDLVTFLKNAK